MENTSKRFTRTSDLEKVLSGFYDSMWSPALEEKRIKGMMQLCMYHDHAVARTLDKSYHGSGVHSGKLEHLDSEQVLTKHLSVLKDCTGKKHKKRLGQQTIPAWDDAEDDAAETKVKSGPDEIIVVPNFWLLKIDQGKSQQCTKPPDYTD